MHSFDKLNKTNVTFSASEIKEMEATARTIVEMTAWMD